MKRFEHNGRTYYDGTHMTSWPLYINQCIIERFKQDSMNFLIRYPTDTTIHRAFRCADNDVILIETESFILISNDVMCYLCSYDTTLPVEVHQYLALTEF